MWTFCESHRITILQRRYLCDFSENPIWYCGVFHDFTTAGGISKEFFRILEIITNSSRHFSAECCIARRESGLFHIQITLHILFKLPGSNFHLLLEGGKNCGNQKPWQCFFLNNLLKKHPFDFTTIRHTKSILHCFQNIRFCFLFPDKNSLTPLKFRYIIWNCLQSPRIPDNFIWISALKHGIIQESVYFFCQKSRFLVLFSGTENRRCPAETAVHSPIAKNRSKYASKRIAQNFV